MQDATAVIGRRSLVLGSVAAAALSGRVSAQPTALSFAKGGQSLKIIRRLTALGDSFVNTGYVTAANEVVGWNASGAVTALCVYSNGAFTCDASTIVTINGADTAQLAAALGQITALAGSVDACVVQAGHNDPVSNVPVSQTIQNLIYIFSQLLFVGIVPIVVIEAVCPTTFSSSWASTAQEYESITSLNEWKREYCAKAALPIYDWTPMTDPTQSVGAYKANYTAADLHPSGFAYTEIAKLSLQNELKAWVPPVQSPVAEFQTDVYDATWAPRGNIMPLAQSLGNVSAQWGQTRTGKTQTVSVASTYTGQASAVDNLGQWCNFVVAGTGTGGSAADFCLLTTFNAGKPNLPADIATGDIIQASCQIVISGVTNPTNGYPWCTLQLFLDGGVGNVEINLGTSTASTAGGQGGINNTGGPVTLVTPPLVVPSGSFGNPQFQMIFAWNDLANNFAANFSVREPTIRKITPTSGAY